MSYIQIINIVLPAVKVKLFCDNTTTIPLASSLFKLYVFMKAPAVETTNCGFFDLFTNATFKHHAYGRWKEIPYEL